MRLGSLFAGIGGFELAATRAGIEPIWSNELDPFACNVLRKNFKHEIIEKDIRELGKHNLESVDIISGGFPCQPFSHAGARKGKEDDRYLWDEMLRIISDTKPRYVLGENVFGLITMENGETLESILVDLENEGYRTETFVVPACAVGAWHRRDRIWIVAHSNSNSFGSHREKKHTTKRGVNAQRGIIGLGKDVSKSRFAHEQGNLSNWEFEPGLGRVADGLPGRVDRLKGLGNAIVPQVAFEIFKTIKAHHEISS